MKLIDADAIDYAIMFDGGYVRLGVYKDEIDKMPTVQLEIIRCNACRHWHQTTGIWKDLDLAIVII